MPTSRVLVTRALVGSPLRRPAVGCLFSAVMGILVLLAVVGHVFLWVSESLEAISVFIAAALLAAVVSLPVLVVLWQLDRLERESVWFFGGAVLFGALVSTGLSVIFNAVGSGFLDGSLRALPNLEDRAAAVEFLTAALVAPPVEEAAKGLALLILFWFLRAEFDNLRDGLLYGALVGLGFNIAEVAFYVMRGYIETGEAPFATQFAARFVFLGLNGHLIFSALLGAGFGLARQTPRLWLRFLAPIVGYLLAMLAHALSNSIGLIVFAVVLTASGYDLDFGLASIPPPAIWFATALNELLVVGWAYVLLAILLVLSAQWEHGVIREALADEVDGETVTADEYLALQRAMPVLGFHPAARGDPLARRIQAAQIELAFRKWHVARDGGEPRDDALVTAWREDIAGLREARASAAAG